MELNSRDCEVSTYTQSSGYNSSTASSSLNFIDDYHLTSSTDTKPADTIICTNIDDSNRSNITKLVITITLLRIEEQVFEHRPYLNN